MEASRGFIFNYEEPVTLTEKGRCILNDNDVNSNNPGNWEMGNFLNKRKNYQPLVF